ncbi:TonB-dependent receptor [Olivibacter sp. SDN3]|uniref:TonB-dependent receptor n=1 Tax=Olivibacter sp. SDN3 TaxID=2764720 RepID=UPI001650FCC7|nr:TonB-dependent receptor [Olivibacter sp. SDN3]QNL49582.1 TonB-dependent receptor [Olivibacter sp. SDN3]
MKTNLIIVFMMCGIMQTFAYRANAQKITLQKTKAQFSEVIDQISQQSDYDFIYDLDLIERAKPIDIQVNSVTLQQALAICFENQPFTYVIKNKTVIVKEKLEEASPIKKKQVQMEVSGIVNDEKGLPLPGVSVMQKGTSNGTTTDDKGAFNLQVGDVQAVLVFRFIGYRSFEQQVSEDLMQIVLDEDQAALDEVVVVGYGTQKKVNLTGAVSSIDFSDVAETRPITSLSAGLAGLSSGMQVQQSTGQPGSDGATLRIRGQGTLNNSDPLVLVDGVPSNMNDVNPQDVANVSILKDAASAAIYGSRAANGVILVTTKRGAAGTSNLTYNVRMSQQEPSNLIDMVSDYPRHMELINEGFNNLTPNSGPFQQSVIDEWRANSTTDPIRYPNTNWFDWILRKKWAQEHNLSATGGNDKTTYLLSANYLDNPGIVENAGFKRYGARVNVESKINDWLTVGSNTFGLWSNAGLANINDLFSFTAGSVPGILPRDPQGRYGSAMAPGENLQANNYLHNINTTIGDLERQKVFSRLYANINLYKGLTLESGFSIDFDNQSQRSHTVYIPRWNFQTEQITNPDPGRNNVYNTHQRDFQYVMNHVLKYHTQIGLHGLDMLAGYQEEYYRRNNFNARRYDLIDESTPVLDATISADPVVGGNATDWALRSFFGRFNYNYDDRYLFEANIRNDGSSRFAKARRWGVFPSFSAGWRISQEAFMSGVHLIDDLKLRASWGSLGNNSIGDYDYMNAYGAANYSFGGTIVRGAAPLAITNALLTWEKTDVTNVGLDLALLNSRLNFEFEWFNRNTKDILIDLPIPLVNGIPTNNQGVLQSPNQNAAIVRNRGVEFSLGWNDKVGEVHYGISANYTYVKNKVMRFKGEEFSLANQNILLEGHPIWAFYVRSVDRIVQEGDMDYIDQLVADGYTFQPSVPQPGDFLYVDANDDRHFNEDDRTILNAGHNPTSLFGLSVDASYKGVSLQVLLQGQAGNKAYWRDGYMTTGVRNGYLINEAVANDYWTPQNPNAKYPRLTNYIYNQNIEPASDFWLQDASFLRVKNIQLGYALPVDWTTKINVKRLFLYLNAENLFTFTNYEGIDPEITRLGATQTLYPTMKQISFGLNVTF